VSFIHASRTYFGQLMSQPDGNVHVVPIGGQNPEHIESKDCWCEPYLAEDYSKDMGVKLYIHKEIQ